MPRVARFTSDYQACCPLKLPACNAPHATCKSTSTHVGCGTPHAVHRVPYGAPCLPYDGRRAMCCMPSLERGLAAAIAWAGCLGKAPSCWSRRRYGRVQPQMATACGAGANQLPHDAGTAVMGPRLTACVATSALGLALSVVPGVGREHCLFLARTRVNNVVFVVVVTTNPRLKVPPRLGGPAPLRRNLHWSPSGVPLCCVGQSR
jgi:hypothetical protein